MITHYPETNRKSTQFVRYWGPRGTRLKMIVVNTLTGRPYTLLRWGNELYLPVEEGDKPKVYVQNGFNFWSNTHFALVKSMVWIDISGKTRTI